MGKWYLSEEYSKEHLKDALQSREGRIILKEISNVLQGKIASVVNLPTVSEDNVYYLAALQNQVRGIKDLLSYLESVAAGSVRSHKNQPGGGVTARR